jgi:hypothetical protein
LFDCEDPARGAGQRAPRRYVAPTLIIKNGVVRRAVEQCGVDEDAVRVGSGVDAMGSMAIAAGAAPTVRIASKDSRSRR